MIKLKPTILSARTLGTCILLISLVEWVNQTQAQEARNKTQHLTRQQTIQIGVDNNLQLLAERLEQKAGQMMLQASYRQFAPMLESRLDYRDNASIYQSAPMNKIYCKYMHRAQLKLNLYHSQNSIKWLI